MSTKADYSAEEWTKLMTAPMYAGMAIITSDPAITSIFGETAAMAKAMVQNPVPASAQDLVGGLVSDLQAKAESREKFEEPKLDSKDPAALTAAIDAYLTDVDAILSAKAGAAETMGYKEWVMSVAQSVAEAGREGGFLGIGSVRVSEQETAALAHLRSVLGLPAAS
ncbi:MAG: hypothetical protein ACK2UK_12675 [Candidatus Promineifilaceae bacterium]